MIMNCYFLSNFPQKYLFMYLICMNLCYFLLITVLQEEIPNPPPNFLISQTNTHDFSIPSREVVDELPRPQVLNRREIRYIFYSFLLVSFNFFIYFSVFVDFINSQVRENSCLQSVFAMSPTQEVLWSISLCPSCLSTLFDRLIILHFLYVQYTTLCQRIKKRNRKRNHTSAFLAHYKQCKGPMALWYRISICDLQAC